MAQAKLETIVGFLVLLVAGIFFIFAYNISNNTNYSDTYIVTANFQDIDGISKGSEIKLAGINIGKVEKIILNDDTYYASVNLSINKKVELPVDSRAMVSTNGILGGKYIRINPGASDTSLQAGERIKFTQSALNIEDLIGKLMYSLTSK